MCGADICFLNHKGRFPCHFKWEWTKVPPCFLKAVTTAPVSENTEVWEGCSLSLFFWKPMAWWPARARGAGGRLPAVLPLEPGTRRGHRPWPRRASCIASSCTAGQQAPAHEGAERKFAGPCGTIKYFCASKKSTLKHPLGSSYHFVIPGFCPKVQGHFVQLERAGIKDALLSLKCKHYPCLTRQLKESCRCRHWHQTMPAHAPFTSCKDRPLTTRQYVTKKKLKSKAPISTGTQTHLLTNT